MKVLIYTANIGAYDVGQYVAQQPPDFDYVLFKRGLIDTTPFEKKREHQQRIRGFQYAAKHIKICFPFLGIDSNEVMASRIRASCGIVEPPIVDPMEYDWVVWVDHNIDIMADLTPLIEEVANSDKPIGVFDHACTKADPRSCAFEEGLQLLINARKGLFFDDPHLINAQLLAMHEDGMPRDFGLLCGGVLVMRPQDSSVVDLLRMWWDQVATHSVRDQLSFDYCRWKLGASVHFFQMDIRENAYLRLHNH